MPTPALCTIEDINNWLLTDYITAAVEFNPTIIEETIESVSGEVWELLSYRYVLPVHNIPSVLRNIAAVFVAYRIMEAITGIVDKETADQNVWIPLQKEYKRMDELLKDIAKGNIKLTLPEAAGGREDPSIAVVTYPREIDLDKF